MRRVGEALVESDSQFRAPRLRHLVASANCELHKEPALSQTFVLVFIGLNGTNCFFFFHTKPSFEGNHYFIDREI